MKEEEEEDFERVVRDFVTNIDESRGWDRLTAIQRTILLVYVFELEISNGGFRQFFANLAGDRWLETLKALREIEASRITALFETAIATFPNSAPSTEHSTRLRELKQTGADELFDALTDEYYGLYESDPNQDSYARMAAYLD